MVEEKQQMQGFEQKTQAERLQALEQRLKLFKNGELEMPKQKEYVNNHIHTIFSFSPYSPTSAAYMAWLNGLQTAGIMDHDSVGGANEFIRAGAMLSLATTVGFECRVKMDKTPFDGKLFNNPDQKSIAYVTCHGIPHQNIEKANSWLAPLREKRNNRSRKIVSNINKLFEGTGIVLNFDEDVVPISQFAINGGITERHVLYALAFKVVAKKGKGKPLVNFVSETLGIEISETNLKLLENPESDGYEYTLLGVFKSSLIEKVYVNADEECCDVTEFVKFALSIGAVPAYAYLGDVGESVTGDKKMQKFEDDFLEELVPWVAKAGFLALTYMPTRNTKQQLARLMGLCEENNLFQISGEDINTPSQSFICKALDEAEYKHLIAATWALIGHEKAASRALQDGMFSEKTLSLMPNLQERILHFEKIGREKD